MLQEQQIPIFDSVDRYFGSKGDGRQPVCREEKLIQPGFFFLLMWYGVNQTQTETKSLFSDAMQDV